MSVASRKCGVHLLQPPSIVTTTIRSTTSTTPTPTSEQQNVEKKKMDSTLTSTPAVSSTQRKHSGENNCSQNGYETMVESFLDENTDFLEDYVRRKVDFKVRFFRFEF